MAGLVVDMAVTGTWRYRIVGQDDVIPDLLCVNGALVWNREPSKRKHQSQDHLLMKDLQPQDVANSHAT